jgi:WD and tetratricopeptide repeat-containing protein 1
VQTDIKEAVFVGHRDQLVACGSDCGHVFVYEADSGALVKMLAADDDVANCVQPHPVQAVLATSGIETAVKLWSPTVRRVGWVPCI